MRIDISAFAEQDAAQAAAIWNRVVRDGVAFPQENELTPDEAIAFFNEQSYTGIARDADTGHMVGLYILHPNNIGRCGHICNASYAVAADVRGQGVGEALVRHCLAKGAELGFRVLQFNAVVASNRAALHLYEKLGFVRLGTIPGGFRNKEGVYEDIIPHYILLTSA